MLIDDLKIKAHNGNKEAQYALGILYSYGDETQGARLDFKEAFKWFRKSAKHGYVPAYNALGLVYSNGEWVKQNFSKALKWFKKAAIEKDVVAFFNLAISYEIGDIVDKNIDIANDYYEKSFETAKMNAKSGDDRAQNTLGSCYKFGNGVEQNYEEAVYWFEKAAEQGNRGAINNLGVCYQYGTGVEMDLEKAFYCYKKAADMGHAVAITNLGICYEYGNGTNQNYKKAVECYKKAAARNYARGQCFLAECYEKGTGIEVNLEKAFNLFKKASKSEFDRAQYYLAECYRYGKGVKKNLKKAVYWYKTAKDHENGFAEIALDELKIESSKKRDRDIEKNKRNEEIVNRHISYEQFLKEQLGNGNEEKEQTELNDNNTFDEEGVAYKELIHGEDHPKDIKDSKKEANNKITQQLEEIKLSILELNNNILASGLINANPFLGKLEEFFKTKREVLEEVVVFNFLMQQAQQNQLIHLDKFTQLIPLFLEEQKRSLEDEIEKQTQEFRKKDAVPEDNNLLKEYIQRRVAKLGTLKKDIEKVKSFSEFLKCEERYKQIKNEISSEIQQRVGLNRHNSMQSIIDNIFSSKIEKLKSTRNDIQNWKGSSLLITRRNCLIKLYDNAIDVLYKRWQEVDTAKHHENTLSEEVKNEVERYCDRVNEAHKIIFDCKNTDDINNAWKRFEAKINNFKWSTY